VENHVKILTQRRVTMKRKSYSPKFEARLAVEAIREQQTNNEITGKHEIYPNQITQWKKMALGELPEMFFKNRKKEKGVENNLIDRLYQQIGKLQSETVQFVFPYRIVGAATCRFML